MAAIELIGVTKVFPGGERAVDGVDLRVDDGEFVVLVGPSGCGKTTTLRLVAGLEKPTDGRVLIDGRDVSGTAPRDRDVAMVFQNSALYPHMTVRQNLAFALKARRVPKATIADRLATAAEVLGIEGLLDRRPDALSGGERQRVSLGRAMVRRPAVQLLDEPLSDLDAALRLEMRAELKRLHAATGTTTLHVTHDQEEAMTLGDRLAVMTDGAIRQTGSPLEVYHRPADRRVAGLLGSPPMNFFEGRLRGEEGVVVFDGGSWRLCLPAERAAAPVEWVGRPVVLGVRPEAMSLRATGPLAGGGNVLRAVVSVVEPLGEKMDVVAATGDGGRIVARVAAEAGVGVGEEVSLHVDLQKVHLFEPGGDGRALGGGAG